MSHLRPYNSVMSEDDYPNAAMLTDFRGEFDAMLQKIIEDDMNRTKTLQYNASMHILDGHREGSDFEDETRRGDGLVVWQRPARHNLVDVMGHFETDNYGNMLIVRKSVIISGVGGSPREVLVDALGRRVNKRGYLVDENANVINKFGEKVVRKDELDPLTDDIPPPLFQALFIPVQAVASRNASGPRRRADTARRDAD